MRKKKIKQEPSADDLKAASDDAVAEYIDSLPNAQLAALVERNRLLEDALWQHLIDVHQWSNRPCETCTNSLRLLGGLPKNKMSRCLRPSEAMSLREQMAGEKT
jgi:hypothetical protein